MKAGITAKVRDAVGKPRFSLMVAAVAAVSLVATTTVTTAAWTDNEWAGGTVGVGSPGDCTTNTLFSSQASARQLSGSVLGVDLDSIAGVEGLTVTNTDGAATPVPVTATGVAGVPDAFLSKLPVTALGGNPVTAALGLGAPVGSLGTYTQWAQAQENGQARAAAGLVTDQSGAVDVAGTATGAATAPDSATISLGSILPASLAGVTLDVGAVASSSSIEGCGMVNGWPTLAAAPTVTREYGVASLDLKADVPAVRLIAVDGTAVVARVPGQLSSLVAPGALTTAITNGVKALVDPLLGTLDSTASTTAKLSVPDLTPVTSLMTGTIVDEDRTIAINPATGSVEVDIAALSNETLGLNGQGPNRAVLDSALNAFVADRVAVLLEQWKSRVMEALTKALREVTIESHTTVTLLGSLGVPVAELQVLTGPATLGDFLAGNAPAPTVTSRLLGVGVGGSLLSSLLAVLNSGANGAVQSALQTTVFTTGLVPEVGANVQALITNATKGITLTLATVSTLVAIHVNVQPDQPWAGDRPRDVAAQAGEYKVSAIRVGIVDQPGLLSLSLGTSTAGPVNYRIS